MAQISVAEAAARLGISPRRVRERIAEGSLHAQALGNQWSIDEASLHRVSGRAGRPLSYRAAWAILAYSMGDGSPDDKAEALRILDLLELSPSEHSLARKRLRSLRSAQDVEEMLRPWLVNRAERRVYRASPRDLDDLRDDPDLLLSGLSHPESGMAVSDLVEGYVSVDSLEDLVDRYLLVDGPDRRSNVVLHIARRRPNVASPLLLAADLAEHHGPRESGRSRELVQVARW
ncbi:MAG: helix-turn-helix domain-containing protein [Nocardioides sp.]|nr:helix-turn-helix domain-containing protein [Nocardioides sp.]